jgi:O-antigen ligase
MYIDFLIKKNNIIFSNFNSYTFARVLIVLIILSLAVSPLMVNIFEIILIVLCIYSKRIREDLIKSINNRVILLSLMLFLIYFFYSFTSMGDIDFGIKKILMIAPAFILFKNNKYKMILIKYFLLGVMIMAFISFLAYFMGLSIVRQMDVGIVARNEVVQSLFFILAINALIIFRKTTFFYSSKLNLIATLFLVLNILLISPAKSGYAGLIIIGCYYILHLNNYKFNPKFFIQIIIFLSVIGSILFINQKSSSELIGAISEIKKYESAEKITSMGIRVIFIKNTIEILKKNPILGNGTESFGKVYEKEVDGRPGLDGVISKDPHNQYLRIWVEQGIIGLLIFLCFIVSCFFQKTCQPYKYLGLSILCVWCFNSLFHSHFSTFAEGGLIFLWLGVMLSSAHTSLTP